MAEQAEGTRTPRREHFRIESGARRGPDWVRLALLASPGLARLQGLRERVREVAEPFLVARLALGGLEVSVQVAPAELERIPAVGPLVITANHPFGGLDGLAAIEIIGRRRKDLRILANPELAGLEGVGELIIPVDPFGGARATQANTRGLRQALRWLAKDGVLLLFPAGEVSSLNLRTLSIADRPWSSTAARLIRLARTPVVPMHFAGANGALFQLAGLVHPRLRTLLLPQELGNKIGARVRVRVGAPITPAKLIAISDDAELAARLRLSAYLLASDEGGSGEPRKDPQRALAPLAAPVEQVRLRSEVDALPPDSLLVNAGELRVYCASAPRLPRVLQELGRLRELTFRAAGEGTGRSRDLDAFDEHYEHLFIWNTEAGEIVGAYRLGRTDLISRRLGKHGLYTSTLFEYPDLFLKLLGPTLEVGRSFVRVEYQKSFAPLMLLWRGIGEYVGRHPVYCKLMGPVSISNDYRPLSRELLVGFLRARNFAPLAPALVRAKRPFRGRFSLRSLGGGTQPGDIDALSSLVAALEPDGKGAPVLLRQYLRLGGRILGFNVDPDFGDALDCLVLVDLRRTETRVLKKYMSEAAWSAFSRAHHRPRQRDRELKSV